jgi:ATP-dependent DNA helicase DinG
VADDAPVWREVVSSSETRIGPKCRFYDQCFVTRMRRAAERSQIIVTNHHLFFADLTLRSGHSGAGALPEYDAVIFDEAHALEDVATEFLRGAVDAGAGGDARARRRPRAATPRASSSTARGRPPS